MGGLMEWLPLIAAILGAAWSAVVVLANREGRNPTRFLPDDSGWAIPGVIPAGPFVASRSDTEYIAYWEAKAAKAIPREIQEEIDQTPGWWDKQYHKLIARLEQKIEHGEVEYVVDQTLASVGAYYTRIEPPYEYPSCPCGNCKRARYLDD